MIYLLKAAQTRLKKPSKRPEKKLSRFDCIFILFFHMTCNKLLCDTKIHIRNVNRLIGEVIIINLQYPRISLEYVIIYNCWYIGGNKFVFILSEYSHDCSFFLICKYRGYNSKGMIIIYYLSN